MLERINITLEKPINTFEELAEVVKETVTVRLNITDVAEYNTLVDKQIPLAGKPYPGTEHLNVCPACGEPTRRSDNYCANCGQRIVFTENPKVEETEEVDEDLTDVAEVEELDDGLEPL